jgi:hypothetical protein
VAVSLSWPTGLNEDFEGRSYVSKFARTGIEAVHELSSRGYLDAAESTSGYMTEAADAGCHPTRKLPHIILLHDESSFDITVAPGVNVPAGYYRHFQSFDGRTRKLLVEGVGGPSWFTEYNVLTGLSVYSFGRFATSVTRIAAGRVYRGLPRSLQHCGYQTFSMYPFYGSFLGSRAFQTTAGIAHYLDIRDLGTRDFEADSFYYDRAIDLIGRERGKGPLFLYVYTVANHFPWDERLRPQLTPDWKDLGNAPDVEEYIRRQAMSAQEYRKLRESLAREFPAESFLIIRYGDHQPQFGARLIDPLLGKEEFAKRLDDVLCDRCSELRPGRYGFGARPARCAVFAVGRAGGGWRSTRCKLLGTEVNPAKVRRNLLQVRSRRPSQTSESAFDGRRLNQGLIDGEVLSVLSVTLRGMFRLARSRISTPHGWLTDQLRLQRCVE